LVANAVAAADSQERANYDLTSQICWRPGGAIYDKAVTKLLGMSADEILAYWQTA
jgi:hypothetical protein